jgi:hypothetical protein
MERQFWAHYRSGRYKRKIGPFATRAMAVGAALVDKPKHKTLMTGYGSDGAWFDIKWHDAETATWQTTCSHGIPNHKHCPMCLALA